MNLKLSAVQTTSLVVLVSIVVWSFSLWLKVPAYAAYVAICALVTGCLGGVFLGLITRTPKPLMIYSWLILFVLTFLPVVYEWPHVSADTIQLTGHMPVLFYRYFDLLRIVEYIMGLPIPFVLIGHHAPDDFHHDAAA